MAEKPVTDEHSEEKDLEEEADIVLDREEILEQIKEKLICDPELKIDEKDYYSMLETMDTKQLKNVLFNMERSERLVLQSRFSPCVSSTLGKVIGYVLNDANLEASIATDIELGNMIVKEFGGISALYLGNPIAIAARIVKHVFENYGQAKGCLQREKESTPKTDK